MNTVEEQKERHRVQRKAYYAANKERLNRKQREYRAANKERLNEHKREYRAANKEREAQRHRQYNVTHREKIAAYHKQYHDSNREREREKSREYYHAHKEQSNKRSLARYHENKEERREYKLTYNYGITHKEKQKMYESQNSTCAICNTPLPDINKAQVDHNHETHRVRGLLCKDCNLMLGRAHDNKKTLLAAIAYLEKYASV